MSYSRKLKDPRWQKKRLEVLQRADWKCEHCGCGDDAPIAEVNAHCENEKRQPVVGEYPTLEIHHKKYKRNCEPWEYDAEELQCLCKYCHGLLKDLTPGVVELSPSWDHEHEDGTVEQMGGPRSGSFSVGPKCPKCGSPDLKDKGSYDKCRSCAFRLSFYPPISP